MGKIVEARDEEEDALLRSVALQNASSILLARRRAEEDLISAKHALEQKTRELAHSLSVMHATLESTADGILVTSSDGTVIGFNDNYLQMWKLQRDTMEATDHRRLLEVTGQQCPDYRQFLARVEYIYASSPPESFDLLQLADGRTFERFSKVQRVDTKEAGRVWSFRDITERCRAEDALRTIAIDNARLYESAQKSAAEREKLLESERSARAEAERMSEMKDEFLATLSHELRTPLSAILGWAHILRRGTRDTAVLEQGLDTIERNARAQTHLIEDLLDMNRITSGKVRLDVQHVEPVAIIEAALETVRPAADAKSISLEKLLDPAAGAVAGDPSRLQQVVWNLLSNAIKFTPKDGKVQVGLQRVASHVEICVSDTGIGIKPEFLAHVFERFRQADASTTRRYGGLGLGLSIVKQLVELHGGTVHARSAGEGQGATFIVHLPIPVMTRSAPNEPRRHPQKEKVLAGEFRPLDLSGIKVLVVDDEADARDLIKRVLVECDAEVITAARPPRRYGWLNRTDRMCWSATSECPTSMGTN
jgi:signal transduction histidine kinase